MGRANRTGDLIRQIAEIRNRLTSTSTGSELAARLGALEGMFGKHGSSSGEGLRYFPVALVACMEAYFRSAIKDLIDSGDPFLGNAEQLAATVKMDFSIIRALHGKSITIGELLAHSVPLSGLDHIDSLTSSLLGKGFVKDLGSAMDRWALELSGQAKPLLADPDTVLSRVARTFELRHIICHEFASGLILSNDELVDCFEGCVAFLRASHEYLTEVLNPGAPLTQAGMNVAAAEELEKTRARLADLIGTLTEKHGADWRLGFDPIHKQWQAFSDGWTEFRVGDRATGGSILPMVYCGVACGLTEDWIRVLSSYRDMEEGQLW